MVQLFTHAFSYYLQYSFKPCNSITFSPCINIVLSPSLHNVITSAICVGSIAVSMSETKGEQREKDEQPRQLAGRTAQSSLIYKGQGHCPYLCPAISLLILWDDFSERSRVKLQGQVIHSVSKVIAYDSLGCGNLWMILLGAWIVILDCLGV